MTARPAWLLMLGSALMGTAGCTVKDNGPASDVPRASAAAALDCAAKLPPNATLIYKDAESDVHPETNMESLLRVKVMMLIVTDRLKRADARPAAERAAECLEMLQK